MKLIRTEDTVGHVLCHDMTQIIKDEYKDEYKDARFRRGRVVTVEDIPVLLSMGKEHLYVWEMTPGMVHENDAAERLLALRPFVRKTACIVSTGSEVKKGLIKDTGATVFDLLLPKIAADVPVTRVDIAALGEGGLCLGCGECHYPVCPFGK